MSPLLCEVLEQCACEPLPVPAMAERLGVDSDDINRAIHTLRARRLATVWEGVCRATPTGRSVVSAGHTRDTDARLDPPRLAAEIEAATKTDAISAWDTAKASLEPEGWRCYRDGGLYAAYHPQGGWKVSDLSLSWLVARARATAQRGRR